jgi:alpha-2-macroglobulin
MRARRVCALILVLIFSTTSFADEPQPYFSLSSDRTFMPGEKVTIHLYARNVDALEFRIYRVKDPIAFFEKLNGAHSFGEHTEEAPINEKTLIERYHDWKRSLWRAIREFFRSQFSAPSRAHIRESQGEARKTKLGSAAMFAQVPLINSSQLVARWKQDLPPSFFSQSEDVPVENLGSGVYLVEATDGTLRAYTIVIVSQVGVITKTWEGHVLAFAADRKTGAPVPDTTIALWTLKKEMARGTTDKSGLYEAALEPGHFNETAIIGVHDADVALVSDYSFEYSMSSNPGSDYVGYIYTDRPVYRPGHPVHFKAILRRLDGEKYKVASGTVHAVVEDTTGKQIYAKDLSLSALGSAHGDLDLPATAALGYYSITVSTGQYSANGGFDVEEYKKPEYEVKVTPAVPHVVQGNKVTATIEAKYYFGEPVANANVKYVVHTSPYWSPYVYNDQEDQDAPNVGSDEGEGNPGDEGEYDYGGTEESEQTGKLDANGKLVVTIPTRVDAHGQDIRYRIEARVTDAANREISGRNSVIATYGDFNVGINADSYVYDAGKSGNFNVIARDYDNKPVRTTVHVELQQWRYTDGRRWDHPLVASKDVQTDERGNASASFMFPNNGSYTVVATAPTASGRTVKSETWVWVRGAGQGGWWWGGNERQVKIIADKKSYAVGDTAKLLILTGVDKSHVLVTTEGRTLQSKRVVDADSSSVTVEIPITDSSQPNFYVGATFLYDNNLYQGQKNVKVPAVQQKLQITIEPTKKQFEPGERAVYNITAKDASGKPAAGEFSVGIVDEAVYAIRPDMTQPIEDAFFGSVYSRVTTASSLNFYFTGEAGHKQMILTQARMRPLAQLKPSESLVQPKIRKNFPDTALWLADLTTDASGRAQAVLEFPDSLTTWRTTVRGVTADTKVGSAIDRTIVRKNLMVRLAVPRFFRQGDEVTVSAIVQNYLENAKDVQVSLDVQGLEVIEGATQTVNVASKGQAKVDWRVRATTARSAVVTTKALTNEESDAMQLTLPIVPYGVKMADAKSGSLTKVSDETAIDVNFPQGTDPSAHALQIDVSPSIAGGIFAALDYLTSYPYGCTEQTMSGFLPDIVVAQAMKDLHLESTINTPELDKKIRAGLDRLYDFQHDDGGWGWWKTDESHVFMTAYVVSGLAQAQAAGYDVRPDVIQRAQRWLQQTLKDNPRMRPDLRAYVVFALANTGVKDKDAISASWKRRDDMNGQGLALLGLALHALGDSRDKEIADLLEKKAKVTGIEASWDSDFDYLMEFEIDDSAETTAYAVRLLSEVKPDSPLLPKAAFWLVNHRDGGYYWESTKQTAMVVFGLTEYMKISHELEANFTADVFVNDKPVFTKHFTKTDTALAVPPIRIPADQLPTSGGLKVRVRKTGPGVLYWATRGEYYSLDKRMVQTGTMNLNIVRDYSRLVPVQEKDQILYEMQPLSGDLHPGDIVAVHVVVAGGKWRYLMIEDPIPAGAEFIERDDLYNVKNRPGWWGDFWFTRREFHDDRAALFQTYFETHGDFFYLLKIVNPGKFRVSPASVQPMYQPGIIATTDAATIEVK